MARSAGKRSSSKRKSSGDTTREALRHRGFHPLRWAGFWVLRGTTILIVVILALVVLYRFVNPPLTHTIWSEYRRIGKVERDWVPIEDVAPVVARSVVAAEDANYCLHWGFDVVAIRKALEDGGNRGGSTISQQVVKNVYLWQGRSWIRKALEAGLTPLVEVIWSKRRIVEVYLNVAEMGEGVFGVAAASERYFERAPDKLTAQQAALIAAILPNPRERSVTQPSSFVRKRAASIRDGAATIRADGRAACFED